MDTPSVKKTIPVWMLALIIAIVAGGTVLIMRVTSPPLHFLTASKAETDAIEAGVANASGTNGVSAGTKVTITVRQYTGILAQGRVVYSNNYPAQDFLAHKQTNSTWKVEKFANSLPNLH